jgi:hypothetical protein
MPTPSEIEEKKRLRDIALQQILAGSAPAPVTATPAPAKVEKPAATVPDLFPLQMQEMEKGTDLYFSAKTGKAKEQVVAEIQNDIKDAPDFTTYAKLSKALSEIERDFKPGEIISFAGERPVKSDEMSLLGIGIRPPAPSTKPINMPGPKVSGESALLDAFRPQTMVGPVGKEFEKQTYSDRAKSILSDAKFAESLKDKSTEEISKARENLEASRSMIEKIAEKLGPDASDEDIIGQFKIEIEDLGPRLEGKSDRETPATITQEPGKAPNIAAQIYSRQTTPGVVPNLTDAQAAYLEKFYQVAFPRLSKSAEAELRAKLTNETVPDIDPTQISEADVAAGGAPKMTTRKRTPLEVEQAVRAQLPGKVAEIQAPWWTTGNRDDILANPEKYAEGGGLLEKRYRIGATKEGAGAYALRMAMSPINIVSTTLGAGAARTGEAVARLSMTEEEAARTPSVMARAREAKGGKAATLPDDFVGDLAESVMLNRGGAQVVGDIYKELGLNENVGMGLGFALDILVPPVGGLASSTVKGTKAFNAARAARAAGLIGAEAPLSAGARAFGNTMRDAWTWRTVANGVGAVAPSSIKILAADETGRMIALREEIIGAAENLGRPLNEAETVSLVERWAAQNEGGGKIAKDFAAAAREGRAAALAEDVATDASRIGKDNYFGGAAKIPQAADRIGGAVALTVTDGPAALSNISEPVIKTIIRNAAGRSDAAADILKSSTGKSSQILTDMYKADPTAVKRAIGATVAYDAFNTAQKAKGFAEFPDLVLISNRFIGTPEVALAAGETAKNTEIGRLISRVASRGSETKVVAATPEMLQINPQRAVAVVNVDPADVDTIKDAINGFERSGIMSKADADYARALLQNNEMSITGLRYLAEANIDSIIAGRGGAVDITNVKAAGGKSGFFGNVTEQVIAKQAIFTPTEMRSAFDGILYRVKAATSDSRAATQFLDVPPATQRAVNDFYAQVGNIDKKIKATYDALRGANPELRLQYGLPPTGPISDAEALQALSRGVDIHDTNRFIDSAVDLVLGGYVDKASKLSDEWLTRSFFTTNSDTYITPAGRRLINDAKSDAVQAIRNNTMPVNDVVKRLVQDINGVLADTNNTTAAWRLIERTALKTEEEINKALPKIIGGSIFTRETSMLADTVKAKVAVDDAVKAVDDLLPQGIKNIVGTAAPRIIADSVSNLTGTPTDEILNLISTDLSGQKLLISGAIKARQGGYVGGEGMIRGMIESLGVGTGRGAAIDRVIADITTTNPTFMRAIDMHAPAYFAAADQAMLRARLNGDSIEDVITVIFEQSRGSNNLPRSLVTGQLVDDAINKFFQEETFGPVMQQIYKELPSNQGAAQKALAAVSNVLQTLGNVRYNMFLYLRPNYHTMNVVTAPLILHSTLGIENAPLLADMYHAGRAMQSGVGKAIGAVDNQIAFIDKVGRPFTYGDLRDFGVRSGLFKTEQQVLFRRGTLDSVIEDAKKMGAPAGVIKKLSDPLNWPADWANSTDNTWRMASFIKAVREGKPLTVAQEIGKKSLFDFGSLPQAEREFASRFLIFYTFARVSAEQLAKTLGNPASLSRFIKQAAFVRDGGKMLYDYAGGEEYDIRRFYLKDKDLARAFWPSEKVGMSEFTSFTPAAPSIDSFMTIAGLLYARTPLEVVAGSQTGLFQFADPLIKEFIAAAPESGDVQRRADKLRLVDPRRVAALTSTGGLGVFTSVFGDLTPLSPTKDTSATYNDSEWQLSPEGYRLYKEFNRWAQVAGLTSTADYYSQMAPGLETPGKSTTAKMLGFGAQERPTAAAQEQAVLKMQEQAIKDRAKLREEQQGLQIKKEIKQ